MYLGSAPIQFYLPSAPLENSSTCAELYKVAVTPDSNDSNKCSRTSLLADCEPRSKSGPNTRAVFEEHVARGPNLTRQLSTPRLGAICKLTKKTDRALRRSRHWQRAKNKKKIASKPWLKSRTGCKKKRLALKNKAQEKWLHCCKTACN